jgi:hydrogenase-4 component E
MRAGIVPIHLNHNHRGVRMIEILENIAKILIILILATQAVIIVKRDILSLIKIYAVQSLLLAVMAVMFYFESGSLTLIALAILTVVSKIIIIPRFMVSIQRKLKIRRDVQFHFLSPNAALFVSLFIVLFVYIAFSSILADLNLSSLFYMGAMVGISIVFMGMMVLFTRKQTITNIIGYLTMENGVLLFSIFLTEMPLIVEILLVLDLVIITLLSTILALGIDTSIEEFHARLIPFQNFRHHETNPQGAQSKENKKLSIEDDD